jgi:hypothetical protein
VKSESNTNVYVDATCVIPKRDRLNPNSIPKRKEKKRKREKEIMKELTRASQ